MPGSTTSTFSQSASAPNSSQLKPVYIAFHQDVDFTMRPGNDGPNSSKFKLNTSRFGGVKHILPEMDDFEKSVRDTSQRWLEGRGQFSTNGIDYLDSFVEHDDCGQRRVVLTANTTMCFFTTWGFPRTQTARFLGVTDWVPEQEYNSSTTLNNLNTGESQAEPSRCQTPKSSVTARPESHITPPPSDRDSLVKDDPIDDSPNLTVPDKTVGTSTRGRGHRRRRLAAVLQGFGRSRASKSGGS